MDEKIGITGGAAIANGVGNESPALCRAVPLLWPKSDFEPDIAILLIGEEAKDDGYRLVEASGLGEFAPFKLRKSPMSGGFLAFHRVASSLAVSSLDSESESTIHLADKRAPCCGRLADPGRNPGDDDIGVLCLGTGDDLPIAWGGSNRPGRDGVPFSPPLSFPQALELLPVASAKLGLTGLARLMCKGMFPGGIESEGCSGTGRCTELRFFADSSCACRNCATVIFCEVSEPIDDPRGRGSPIGDGGASEAGDCDLG